MAKANFRYSLSPFLAPTVFSFTSEQAAWPAINAMRDFVPRRPWKTTTTGSAQDLVLDFTTTTVVQALYIAWTNFDHITVAGSADNSSYTTITPAGYTSDGTGLLIPKDPDLLRRRLIVDMTGGIFNYRYLRLRISSGLTTDNGAAYYSIGGITVGATLSEFPQGLAQAPSFTFPNPETVADFPSGSMDVNELSVPRVSMSFSGSFVHSTMGPHIRAIDRIGSKPILVYPSVREGGTLDSAQLDPSKAYLMRRKGEAGREYGDMPEVFSKQFTFDEII